LSKIQPVLTAELHCELISELLLMESGMILNYKIKFKLRSKQFSVDFA